MSALLPALIVWPLLGAFVLLLAPPRLARTGAGIFGGGLALLVLATLLSFVSGGPLVFRGEWLPSLGVDLQLTLDALAWPYVAAVGLLPAVAMVLFSEAHWRGMEGAGSCLFLAAAMGAVLSENVMLTTGAWGTAWLGLGLALSSSTMKRQFSWSLLTAGFSWVGALWLGVLHYNASQGQWRFGLGDLEHLVLPPGKEAILFWMLTITWWSAVPLMPVHGAFVRIARSEKANLSFLAWLPAVVGIYLYQRHAPFLFPRAAREFGPLLQYCFAGLAVHAMLCSVIASDKEERWARAAGASAAFAAVGALDSDHLSAMGVGFFVLVQSLALLTMRAALGRPSLRGRMLAGYLLAGGPGGAAFVGGLVVVAGVFSSAEAGGHLLISWLVAGAVVGTGVLCWRGLLDGTRTKRSGLSLGSKTATFVQRSVFRGSIAVLFLLGLWPNLIFSHTQAGVGELRQRVERRQCIFDAAAERARVELSSRYEAACPSPGEGAES